MHNTLQYVTLTRPDITYYVNQLCQHMHSPTSFHLIAAKRVLRYLKGSLEFGLHYCKGSIALTAYCDSDWAGNPDDRRSTTGYGIFLGPNLISWSAKKQHVVSRSSTEADYRSLSLTAAELFWLRILIQELQISLNSPPTLWCDNSGALALASNPIFHAKTKHIEVDFHFIWEKVANRDLQLYYLSTLEQIADLFTKGHTVNRFCYLRDKLRVVPPLSLQGVLRKFKIKNSKTLLLAIWFTFNQKRKILVNLNCTLSLLIFLLISSNPIANLQKTTAEATKLPHTILQKTLVADTVNPAPDFMVSMFSAEYSSNSA